MDGPFVHLRVRTAFSLLESAIRIKELAEAAARMEMPALAMTDSGNLFGAYEFSDRMAGAGVQPILGCTLAVSGCLPEEGRRRPGEGRLQRLPTLALLARSEAGWANLMKLSSRAYLDTRPGEPPHVDLRLLATHAEDLICLTGGPEGPLNRLVLDGHPERAEALAARLSDLFGDRLYVELQRHGLAAERRAEGPLLDLAYARGLPIVATNDCLFLTPDMHEAHDALLCISEGSFVMSKDRRRATPEHYLKSGEEMAALFSDLPEAVETTARIARRCAFRLKGRAPILPAFAVGEGRSEAEELEVQAREGLTRRLAEVPLARDAQAYWDRLDYELGVINGMKFPGYFLIVSDFMKWARARGIPVGVRGSGATSIVAWAMEITSLDPLRFNLVFERFLNPERVSMPDFDIDFCQDRREEVIRYVQDKYGAGAVAQIITFGTLQARAVVRDVGRVLQMPYGQVDRICKMIPNPPGKPVKLRDAIAGEERLRQMIDAEPEVASLMAIAEKLEGLYRHASTHAAGLVIGDRPLDELIPLFRDPKADMQVTQFDYRNAEKVGLVKFDFLGLKTLTVIAKTEALARAQGRAISSESVSFDDTKAYEMLARGESIGVFQLESPGMRDLLRKMKPDRIEDLIALVALYRPGPMDSIPKYIACKHGREAPDYLHPMLEPILEETFGVMTYQEDVMRIARELAGYSLGEADLLRRAMGKKIAAEMDRHRERFVEGAGRNGIDANTAGQIFDQAAKFAGYGFNKGHAAAYAQVAYQTAYLKANAPAEFLCASMTLDMERHDRLAIFRQEAVRMGIGVAGPDINRSEVEFSVARDGDGPPRILYGLGAIKNVGVGAMESVIAERAARGPFADMIDFARRIDPRAVTKRTLENLARAGAFDSLDANRRRIAENADFLIALAQSAASDRQTGQVSLFGAEDARSDTRPRLPEAEDWPPLERLAQELGVLGFYLSGHPLDDYAVTLRRLRVLTFAELLDGGSRLGGSVRLAGTVVDKKEKKSARDAPYAFVTLSDATSLFEVMVFSEVLMAHREELEPGQNVVLTVEPDWSGEEVRFRAQGVQPIDRAAAEAAAGLRVYLDEGASIDEVRGRLGDRRGKGRVTLTLVLNSPLREVDLELPGGWLIDGQVRQALKQVRGVSELEEV